jgi:hypothetical protein
MKRFDFVRSFVALLAAFGIVRDASAQTAADPNEGSRLTLDIATGGYDFSWWGKAGRTYFIQHTDDLLTPWNYLFLIESGADDVLSWGFYSEAERFFLRLRYSDIPTTDPYNADFDGDKISNFDELWLGSDPLANEDTDSDGIPDAWELYYGLDPDDPSDASSDLDDDDLSALSEFQANTSPWASDTDDDGLSDGDEVALGSSPTNPDTDGDEMPDGFEVQYRYSLDPTDGSDATSDSDADGLTALQEYRVETRPDTADSDSDGISDAQEDRDFDGLTNLSEFATCLTDPAQPDTDLDSLSDGWEIANGFDATTDNYSDGDPHNDPEADPDNDGLTNTGEDDHSTSALTPDTDGDGVDDGTEASQGSNPNDPNDSAPPPAGTVGVDVTFGDHSGSHSEKYRVTLSPLEGDTGGDRFRTNRAYGQTQTDTFRLPKGSKYKVTLTHVATDPAYKDKPRPDYDYTLNLVGGGGSSDVAVITEDPNGILGVHHESSPYFAAGKDATLYVVHLASETAVSLPADRKRSKLGVGEKVSLTMKPTAVPTVTWALSGTTGTSGISPASGATTTLTAGERDCSPTVEATILGMTLSKAFTVVEPTGVVMRQESGTGTWHIHGKPSAGFYSRPFITPNDVSFVNIEVREGTCTGTGTGYYSYQHGLTHPDGSWVGVGSGDTTNPSKANGIDTIRSGADGPAIPAVGAFDWPIPWLFRVSSGSEKAFTTVTHHHESDSAGRVTISKGGVSVSANVSDPTTP